MTLAKTNEVSRDVGFVHEREGLNRNAIVAICRRSLGRQE
jgi:hypothetical protein